MRNLFESNSPAFPLAKFGLLWGYLVGFVAAVETQNHQIHATIAASHQMETGTMTLDSDGGCFLPVDILQEVGWQLGEKLTVESVGGIIHVVRAYSLIGESPDVAITELDQGDAQFEK